MKPGDWITSLNGYPDRPEGMAALVLATSRCAFPMTDVEVEAALEKEGYQALYTDDWFGSTKAHRENDNCECDPGGFCSDGGGSGWVKVLLAVQCNLGRTES